MWLFENKEFEGNTEGFYGFDYEIENNGSVSKNTYPS